MNLQEYINLIDNSIEQLKKLSIPKGYSDPFFASLLTEYYNIKSDIYNRKNDPLLTDLLSGILNRIELQHDRLAREESLWLEEYNTTLNERYQIWSNQLKMRVEFIDTILKCIECIELRIVYTEEWFAFRYRTSIEAVAQFNHPLATYLTSSDSQLPITFLKTLRNVPNIQNNQSKTASFIIKTLKNLRNVLEEAINTNFTEISVFIDNSIDIDKKCLDWFIRNGNREDEDNFQIQLKRM